MISPFSPTGEDEFRHLQARSHIFYPRVALTVEITNVFSICDKNCQNSYKSVPIFMSFISFEAYFSFFILP
jgi:hypothetical protein